MHASHNDTCSSSAAVSEQSVCGDLDAAVRVILDRLTVNPASAPFILPGYEIVQKRGEAGAHLHLARKLRGELNKDRLQRVTEVIERERRKNPAVGFHELAAALNSAGLKTYRGYPFTYTRTEDHLRRVRKAACSAQG